MIDYVIQEQEENYVKIIRKIIEQEMMNYDDEYHIKEELDIPKNHTIYIMNYSLKERKSIKAIRDIRQKDWKSMMILTTSTERGIRELLSLRVMPVDIILKDKDYENFLKQAIHNSLRNIKERKDTLSFEYKNIIYNIPINTILYIEKTKEEKKCRIHTSKKDYIIPGNIKELEDKYFKHFTKCSRSHLINAEQVLSYNKKDNIITFRNQETFLNTSRNYKKELIDILRKVE